MGEGRIHSRIAYARAGVDVGAGERAVELMRAAVESTRRPEVLGGLGGFGGAVSIPAGYREPLIVSSTDGVGTKTAIASALGRWDSIGIDLVAMCADDVVCSGAEPLAFLDYVAIGRLDPETVSELVGGVAAGCREAGCALVGGETAEHPGLMEAGTFDLAGTCLGIVERDELLDGTAARRRRRDLRAPVVGAPCEWLRAGARTDRAARDPAPAAVPGAAGDDPRRCRAGCGRGRGARRRAGDGRRRAARADAHLRPPDPRGAEGAARRRPRPARRRAHHRWRAARQRPAVAATHARRPAGSVALVDALGHGAPWGPRRHRGRRAPGHVQRWARDGGRRRAGGRRRRSPLRCRTRPSSARWWPRRRSAGGTRRAGSRGRGRRRRWSGSDDRPRRGRRLRRREQPARPRGRGGAWRARRRGRHRVRRPGVPRARLGGRAGDRDRPPARAGRPRRRGARHGRRGARRHADGSRDRGRRARGLHAHRRAGDARRLSRTESSTRTHRSSRHSRAGTPSATRSTMASGSPAARFTWSTPRSTAARSCSRSRCGIAPTDDETSLHDRIRAAEHRLLPRAVALVLAGAVHAGGRRVRLDAARADAALTMPRRALLSVSDKTGLADLGQGLVARGFELVSTGGTAAALRTAGLPVTDVSAVTGFAEVLDGRVKTLHPAIHAGVLADRRRPAHREALIEAGIAPFELVVVNLYPFAAATERAGITFDELVEEIDIGGPSLIRAAAKNHASVAVVTDPARYPGILAALDEPGGITLGLRSALAVDAFRHTAAYDARIAAELPCRMDRAGVELPPEPGLPRSADQFPPLLVLPLEKVETLRYGENPHQHAARYRRIDRAARASDGPFAVGAPPLQGKALSYNNVLDAAAAAAIARQLQRARVRRRQAHQSVRRRRARHRAGCLDRGPRRRSGRRVRRRRRGDPAGRRRPRDGADQPVPRGRAGSRLRAGRARGPRREAEPPARGRRAPRRRTGRAPRGRRRNGRLSRLNPERRRRDPRRCAGRRGGRPRRVGDAHLASRRRGRRPRISTSPGGWSVA